MYIINLINKLDLRTRYLLDTSLLHNTIITQIRLSSSDPSNLTPKHPQTPKNANVKLLPNSILNLDPNFKELYARFNLPITGSYSPKVGYDDMYKAVAIKTPATTTSRQFHNSVFVGWDIETMAVDKVERAYIISWVVSKGSIMETGLSINIASDFASPEKQLKLVQEFLTNVTKCIKNIGQNPKNTYFYAHNSGLFDLHVIIPRLIKIHAANSKIMPEIIADNSNDIYQFNITFEGNTFYFRDSMKILPMSLKSVGDNMLGGEFGKMEIDHKILRTILTDHKETILTWSGYTYILPIDTNVREYETPIDYLKAYAIQDSIVVVKALKKFSSELSKIGYNIPLKECITASSIGINLWKRHFNSHDNPIIQIHLNTRLHGELNKAYVGGRVEVFNSGLGYDKMYHFDVPGLYAGIMQKPLPIGNPTFLAKFNPELSQESAIKIIKDLHDTGKVAFFKCIVTTPANIKIPVLPIKHQGKLTFPLGKFGGTWFRVELLKAMECGYQIKFIEGWVFNAGTPLASYSETLSQLKDKAGLEGNKTLRTVMKLLINSLYGKFASKYFLSTTEIIKRDNLNTVNELFKVNSITKIDSNFMIVNHDIKPIVTRIAHKDLKEKAYNNAAKALADKDLNVAVAAAITAYGRVQLLELMIEVEGRGGNICYTDTDSVFCTLPESPFNKPFGPYTWVGPAEEHTFKKALFLAPKIYYLEDLNGKITFKVKGVNTNNRDLNYEGLEYLFISKRSAKFTKQIQFRRVSKDRDMGIIITENLEKAYELQLSSKRSWEVELPHAWTNPLTIDAQIISNKAISKLSECNLDIVVNTLKDKATLNPIQTTTDTFTQGDINQYLSDQGTSVNITLPFNRIIKYFSNAWTHALRTAAVNTNIFNDKDIANLQALQILTNDSHKTRWKTLAFFKNTDWLGYRTRQIQTEVLNKISILNVEYDNAYNWDTITIKLNFTTVATLATYTLQSAEYKLKQELIRANKDYETTIALKKEIASVQARIDAVYNYTTTTKEIIDQTLKTYELAIEDFQREATKYLYKTTQNKANLGDSDIEIIKNIMKLNIDITPDDVRITLASLLVQSLKITIQNNHIIEFHNWVNVFMKISNIEVKNEAAIRLTMATIHIAMMEITTGGFFTLFIKGKVVANAAGFKTTPYIITLSDKWADVATAMKRLGMLNKTRFIPKNLKYDKDRQDQTLKSIDKVNQINQYNSVKVILHPLYSKFLDRLQPTSVENKNEAIKLLGLQKEGKWNAFIIEITTILNTKNLLQAYIGVFQQPYYYNNFFADTRGRIYPELTGFRYIGSKWLRPLFCLENSQMLLDTFPTLSKVRNPKLPQSRRDLLATYWTLIAEIFKLEMHTYETPIEFLQDLKDLQTEKLDPQLKVRILEIEYMIEHGRIPITRPFQIDMKNNAIQHARTIVNNEEGMRATGVIPTPNEVDMYIKVATKTLRDIMKIPQTETTQEILTKLPQNDPTTLKTMREITKRPTIVIIYSATKFTIMEYIFQILIDKGIIISKEARILLAEVIIENALGFLAKEVSLIQELKNLIRKEIPYLEWNFGELTDYRVKDVYYKLENKEIKIRHAGRQFHTTYNVVTNKVDIRGMKDALFVNIIHSIDALHLILTSKEVIDKNFIPIHDAYLINWTHNKIDLMNKLNETFTLIHNEHKVFKPIVNRLSQRTGKHNTYETLIATLHITQTQIKGIPRLAI